MTHRLASEPAVPILDQLAIQFKLVFVFWRRRLGARSFWASLKLYAVGDHRIFQQLAIFAGNLLHVTGRKYVIMNDIGLLILPHASLKLGAFDQYHGHFIKRGHAKMIDVESTTCVVINFWNSLIWMSPPVR
ncbi:MAG: hypothetical protein JWR26_4463 [Pedosphaera sp.]|nr:hypothetical protein [Pedosphaera sp.]